MTTTERAARRVRHDLKFRLLLKVSESARRRRVAAARHGQWLRIAGSAFGAGRPGSDCR